MSTIEQLAGGSQRQETSTNVGTAQGYRPAQKVAGESLAQDLMSIMKPAQRVTEEYQTASIKAAQRSAMDKKTELAKFIAEQQSQITPDTDLREVQANISTFYATQTKTIFDTEDAQNAFDTLYTKDAGLSVAQLNAKYESDALKNDAKVNRVNNLDGISAQLSAGIIIPKEQIDEHVDSITAGGYYTKERAYEDIAYAMNTALNEQYKINKNLPIYNDDGTVNGEMQAKAFNKQYGSMVQMDESGVVTAIGDTTDKARMDIINNWNTLKVNHTSRKSSFNAKFELLKESMTKSGSNTNADYVPSGTILEQINSFREQMIEINSEIPLDERQMTAYRKKESDLYNQASISAEIEHDLTHGDINLLRTYLRDGKQTEFIDNATREKKTWKITADKYSSLVNKVLEEQSKALFSQDIDPKNETQFKQGLMQLERWEQISEKTSAFSRKQNKVFDDSSVPQITSGKDLRQALAYHQHKAVTNPAYQADNVYVARLEELLGKTIDGKPLSNLQLAKEANSIITVEKNTRQEKLSADDLDKQVREGMVAVAEGEGFFGKLFTLEADMGKGSITAVKKYINANSKWAVAKDTAKGLTYTDYGTLILGTDQRIVVPIGVKEATFKTALHRIRKDYNKKFKADLDEADVLLETVYDKGTNNFKTIMRVKDNDELIGALDVTSTYLTAAKD